MSTYNGGAYLQEQINSITAQDHPDFRLIVRDDGSTDGSLRVLNELKRTEPATTTLLTGGNVGARNSFFKLLHHAPSGNIVFFADQDDIWHVDKMTRAATALGSPNCNKPRLYCSRLRLIGPNGDIVGHSPKWPQPPSFANALVENIATGCTVAINPALHALLKSKPTPQHAIMHDWWFYLVASAFGEVTYDPEPSIDYRLHATNNVGLPKGHLQWMIAKLRRQLSGKDTLQLLKVQAREFEVIFADDLSPDQRAYIAALNTAGTTLPNAVSFARQSALRRQFRSDTLALKALQFGTALARRARRTKRARAL